MSLEAKTLGVAILAAGLGKRMLSSTAKLLHPLGGKPLLLHVLEAAKSLSPKKIVLVLGPATQEAKALFGQEISYAFQSEPKGTADAVEKALPHLAGCETLLVLLGDVPLLSSETLTRLVQAAQGPALAIIVQSLEDPRGYGRVVREKDHVMAVVEEKDATPEERAIQEVNTGVIAGPTMKFRSWLEHIEKSPATGESYLTAIFALARQENFPICAIAAPKDEALGINTPFDLACAERLYQERLARKCAQEGLFLTDPRRLDVRGELVFGRDCHLDVGVVLEGRVVLEDGARVGPYCVLRDAILRVGATVHPFSVIEGSEVGPGATVGPMARLRPGSVLEEGVHVGNFVELKKTRMGRGSKAGHLTYLGDSTVGSEANIGAGTITCNYDGREKHQTHIGEGAFIGSHTALVAPVAVGEKSYVGAGSIITRDVPPQMLAVARARQRLLHRRRLKSRPEEQD